MAERTSRRRFLKRGAAAVVCLAPLSRAGAQTARPRAGVLDAATPAPRLIADLRAFIPGLMRHHGVPGLAVAVIRDGRVVWGEGFGVRSVVTKEPVTAETPFEGASLSKAAFAYAVLKLSETGKLSLDTPLWQYRPDYFLPADDPRSKLVTARMILSHSSGLRWRGEDKTVKFVSDPGKQWNYSPLGYGYLQQVVEHVTGQPLEAFMQASVLRPFGMTRSSYEWTPLYEREAARGHDRSGDRVADRNFYEKFRGFPEEEKAKIRSVQPEDAAPGASFSLTTTAPDYARLLAEIMRPSRRDESRLSDKTRAEMLTPQVKVSASVNWGLGWEVERGSAADAFYHYGNASNFQNLAVGFAREGAGVVIMTNSGNGLRLTEKLASRALGSTRLAHTFSFA